MADNEVSKLTWIAIVVALAASIYSIAKPQIDNLTNATFDKISAVTSGIRVSEIKHTAYANNVDGTDGFSTTKPNLNLLDGTKDFSGFWDRADWGWENDGTYKGLTVKKRRNQWGGINKKFTAPKDGTYTFSAYVKSSGDNAHITRYVDCWDHDGSYKYIVPNTYMGNNFDWLRDSLTVTLKARDTISARYEISGSTSDSILWTAGHKWEEGATATTHTPSASEVKPSDLPKYIGTYTDKSDLASQDPKKYTWKLNPDYHE